jgi:hypothetical protein
VIPSLHNHLEFVLYEVALDYLAADGMRVETDARRKS